MQEERHMQVPDDDLASRMPAPGIQPAVTTRVEPLLDEWLIVDSTDCSPRVPASRRSALRHVQAMEQEGAEEEQQVAERESAPEAAGSESEEHAKGQAENEEHVKDQAVLEDLSPRSDSAAADQVLGRPFSTTPRTTPITTPRKGSTWSLWSMDNAAKDAAASRAPASLVARLASVSASSANLAWSGITALLGPPVSAACIAWCTALEEFSGNVTQLALLIRDDFGEVALSLRHALGSAHEMAGHAWVPLQDLTMQASTSVHHAFIRVRKMAPCLNRPMSPRMAVSLGVLTTCSLAAAATLAFSNRNLFQQLQKRDRDLAQMVLSIVELSQAMKSQAAHGPILRHASTTSTWPSLRPFFAASLV